MRTARMNGVLCSGALLAFGATGLLAVGSSQVSRHGVARPESGVAASTAMAPQVSAGSITPVSAAVGVPEALPGIARFVSFTPTLPAGLPASFELEIPLGNRMVSLTLNKSTVRGDRFQVLVDVGHGNLVPAPAPEIRTYTGSIAGQPGSQVALSLLPTGGVAGMVHEDDGTSWAFQPMSELSDPKGPIPPASLHASYASSDTISDGGGCGLGRPGLPIEAFRVGQGGLSQHSHSHDEGGAAGQGGSDEGGIAGTTPSQVEIACDTDFEFFQRNQSSVTNTVNDIELVLNNVNVVYDRDVNIIFELGTIVVRSASTDPYAATTMDGRLTEFGSKWSTTPESGIFRDISHLFSGYGYTGSAAGTLGIAYLGGVCTAISQAQYGVVQGRQTTLTTNLNNRIALSSHELGHNWDATHCDSAGAANCHIMCSGLGGCGGITGSNLKFDSLSIGEINTHRNSVGCDFARPVPLAIPFEEPFATITLSTSNWTYNDGGVVTTAAVNEPSAPYSLNLNSTGAGAYDDDEVRTNFILAAGATGARVRVKVLRGGVESGKSLTVEYLSNGLDWTVLQTIVSDGAAQSAFVAYEWALPANGLHDRLRLRFRPDGADSSDNWYIDDVAVTLSPPCPADLNNDGEVGAVDLSTVLANWGNSGSGDINADGTVGGIDLSTLLAAWGPCP